MFTVAIVTGDPKCRAFLRMVLPPYFRLLEELPVFDLSVSVLWDRPDAVIVDSDDDPETVRWMVRRVQTVLNAPPVIVISSEDDARTIVDAVHGGAFDYVTRPFNLERLVTSVQSAAVYSASRHLADGADEKGRKTDSEEADSSIEQFLGTSKLAEEIRATVIEYSQVEAPVLLYGESGVGKDLVARIIHSRSRRSAGPYMEVNCAAVPDTLVESELFGSERGAFTDAVSRAGILEQSYGGTLFLDEIGDASPHFQAKLLRAIESPFVVRVGGSRPTPIDFRLIAATNRHLRQRVTEGLFRDDLYYRVGVLPLQLPPLRERVEDIPILAWHRLKKQTRGVKRFSPAAMDRLVKHEWPGNVRELNNVILRGILFSRNETITAQHIVFDPV